LPDLSGLVARIFAFWVKESYFKAKPRRTLPEFAARLKINTG
jgi:hypothetical protein